MACSVPLEMAGVVPVGVSPPVDGVAAASSWPSSSAALCHRSAGRFSRQRMRRPLSTAGTAGRRALTGSGTCVMWAASSPCAVGAVKGGWPVSIS